MIEEMKNESLIKKVSIEYEDGTSEVLENELILVVTDKGEKGKWNVKLSEQADLEYVLNFAYDAVDEIERANMDELLTPNITSHLRLVKG